MTPGRVSTLCSFALFSAWVASGQTTTDRTIEIGFEQRVRNENWNNIIDFSDGADDQRNQVRSRTRVWASMPLTSNISLFAGLDSETNKKLGVDLVGDEAMVESLYLDIKRVFTPRLSLRIGRQNLQRGECFLLCDGNPADGSRSFYYNAADLTLSMGRSKLEFIAISDPAHDRYLPRIHNQNRVLNEWDERAAGLYYTSALNQSTDVEAYYFIKQELNDCRGPSNRQFQPDRHLHTAGGRVVHRWSSGWTATGEFAAQTGRQAGEVSLRGWGGYSRVRRTFHAGGKPYLQAGYQVFSGDDPATKNRVEAWDPLFSRGAQWSELFLYGFSPEKGIAYWTNLTMPQLEAGWTPRKRLGLRATYYRLGAFHPFAGDSRFGGGTNRGPLVEGRVDLTVNQYWKGHVVYEYLAPGSFYANPAAGYFLRFEVTFTAKMNVPM